MYVCMPEHPPPLPFLSKQLAPIRETLGHVDSLFHEGKFVLPGVEGVPAVSRLLKESEGFRAEVRWGEMEESRRRPACASDDPIRLCSAVCTLADPYLSAPPTPIHLQGQAALSDMLASAHEALRDILEHQVDFYKVT